MVNSAQFRRAALAATVFGFLLGSIPAPHAYAATEVAVVVNRTPITNGDIAKRTNFLKLQHQKGNLASMAKEQLIEETLKRDEIARVKMSVSTEDVEKSFERFATSNKMTPQQMTKILDQAGVGADHFKAFIAVQMSWPRLVNARFGSQGRMAPDELVKRMQESKTKPVTTEYFLQQVIFVIPAAKQKALAGKRKAEAEAARAKYPGCDQAKEFAKTMHDVSIRSLGRVMTPELPDDWKPLIEKAAANGTTGTRVTDKGVEFLAICKQRQVSDDTAAEVVFRAEDIGKMQKGAPNPNEAKYLEELRKKAQIVTP